MYIRDRLESMPFHLITAQLFPFGKCYLQWQVKDCVSSEKTLIFWNLIMKYLVLHCNQLKHLLYTKLYVHTSIYKYKYILSLTLLYHLFISISLIYGSIYAHVYFSSIILSSVSASLPQSSIHWLLFLLWSGIPQPMASELCFRLPPLDRQLKLGLHQTAALKGSMSGVEAVSLCPEEAVRHGTLGETDHVAFTHTQLGLGYIKETFKRPRWRSCSRSKPQPACGPTYHWV